ncbi:MAG TPA: serine protease [Vicinamibacterales bacterium]|nr:serine protease [Vicinamibacterales bacterium]
MRAIVHATLVAALLSGAPAAAAQATVVLHIRIVLTDAGQTSPVPGHALLISDNPSTAPPRLIRTKVDGTADVTLRPGNYTIESDAPATFHGRAYQWTQTIDVRGDTALSLTAANADVTTATAAAAAGSRPVEADPAFLLPRWQDSVVTLWTPTAAASAFLIDARGLIETNQKPIGSAASVEVQLTPAIKVAGRVLAADAAHDVAIVWIDPGAIASIKPIPSGCSADPAHPAQEVFAIDAPVARPKDITSGTMSEVKLGDGGNGGPVFTPEGMLVGVTSGNKVVPQNVACALLSSAEGKMTAAQPPSSAHLPIEPDRLLSEKDLKAAAKRRAGSLNPYQVSSQTFDVSFITPVMIAGEQRNRLFDFGSWSEYAGSLRPVLYVRVTPKMVEGFWTKVARGAAYTQGAAIPAIKHATTGFAKLRVWCGEREVTPIHPFILEQQISEKETLAEGLYVFDPSAFGPQCGTMKLDIFSEKAPEKAETRVVESGIVQRILEDFAP